MGTQGHIDTRPDPRRARAAHGEDAADLYPVSVTSDPAAARYRRRRRWPMLVVIGVLFAGGIVIWFQALKPVPTLGNGCNTPGAAPTSQSATSRSRTASGSTAAPSSASRSSTPRSTTPSTLGTFTDKNTLSRVRPSAPEDFVVNVFNASEQRGMAKTLSDEMRSVGFERIDLVDNDPLYPAYDLRCVGEIRYGNAGVASARTALMMMPCAQLVVDNRVDDSVDIAVGALYTFAVTSDEVKAVLTSISQAAAPPAVIDGRTIQATRSSQSVPPLPNVTCPS